MAPISKMTSAVLCVVLFVLSLGGCRSLRNGAHADKRREAEQNWNAVRGKIKLQVANDQLRSGHVDDAARGAEEALSLEPNSADAYVVLVRAKLEQGSLREAERILAAASREGAQSAELDYLRGVVFEQTGRVEAAIEQYANAHQAAPQDPNGLVAQLECLLTLGRIDAARELLEENAARVEDHAALSLMRAEIAGLASSGDQTNQHASDMQAAAATYPESIDFVASRLLQAGRANEVITLLTSAPGAQPDSALTASARRTLAAAFLHVGDPQAALTAIQTYAGEHRSDAAAQVLLAQAALLTADPRLAHRALDRLPTSNQAHSSVLLLRAVADWQANDPAAARSNVAQVLRRDPNDIEAQMLLSKLDGDVAAVSSVGTDHAAPAREAG